MESVTACLVAVALVFAIFWFVAIDGDIVFPFARSRSCAAAIVCNEFA
jgi:hypothetical protein